MTEPITSARTILQVNAQNSGGGAERVAADLFEAYRRRGLRSYLAVGRKFGSDPDVLAVSTGEGHGRWYRAFRRVADKFGGPVRALDEFRGIESFHYPATYRLPFLPPHRPDIIHAHNLHGGYFDLRALPWLSRQAPLVLTLHDAWLLSGHCSHSFGCDRWKTGCGACPDLTIYPAIRRDETALNWQRKSDIYAQSRLFVATPCAWLMDRVRQSSLASAVVEARVIPNGVDLTVFRPTEKLAARNALGIDPDVRVLLFVASGGRQNAFKDYGMLRSAVRSLARDAEHGSILLLVLGDTGTPSDLGGLPVRFIPFEPDPAAVARYYQAADLYLHAARAETFPMTILEALACGTPIVATAVGGIPDQVRSLKGSSTAGKWREFPAGDATGVLVAPGDGEAMAQAARTLLDQNDLRTTMARTAAQDARSRFDLETQCKAYLSWYDDILNLTRSTRRVTAEEEAL